MSDSFLRRAGPANQAARREPGPTLRTFWQRRKGEPRDAMLQRVLNVTLLIVFSGTLAFASEAELAGRPATDLPPAKLQQLFHEAGRAYDEGRMADAVDGYVRLLQQGFGAQELFYNLGNAYFRQGQWGQAILNYRRAWMLRPRDPDVRANLRFALQTAGIPEPVSNTFAKPFLFMSQEEWVVLGVAAYWIGAVLLSLYALWRSRPAWLLRLAGLAGLVLLLSAVGFFQWERLCRAPEVVVTEKGHEALFAPLEGSTAHFTAPEGSILRVVERSGSWVKVARDDQLGWLPASACTPVCFWLELEAGMHKTGPG